MMMARRGYRFLPFRERRFPASFVSLRVNCETVRRVLWFEGCFWEKVSGQEECLFRSVVGARVTGRLQLGRAVVGAFTFDRDGRLGF